MHAILSVSDQKKLNCTLIFLLVIRILLLRLIWNIIFQNLYAPDDDPEMKVEKYERTAEQNEELGINDMRTENYENDIPEES